MIQHYREMLDDPLRLDAFRRAILAAIAPGEVVADIGSGLGTYAVFAARAGAARVYAIEEGAVAVAAREVIQQNGCEGRVQVLRGRSTEIDPPERVDVAIFEDYVTGFLTPAHVALLRDLRARWLKPGGRLLPARARVWCAAVEARAAHLALDLLADRREQVLGIDYAAARRRAFATPSSAKLTPAALIAGASVVQEVELATVEECRVGGKGEGTVVRDGLVHGVLVWFELELPPAGWLGTGPLDPPSAWRQSFLPFDVPLAVKAGEPLSFEVAAAPFGAELVWRWRVSTASGSASAHSLDGLLLGPEAVHAGRPDCVPARNAELELDLAIMSAVDGVRDLAAIAALVHGDHPTRFASAQEAEARVARVVARYRGTLTQP